MGNKDNKKEKDRVTISITIPIREELYKELSKVAEENGKSISQVIETVLRNAREAFWEAEYRERLRKEPLGLLKVGDPLKYGPLRYPLPPPVQIKNENKEKEK